MPTEDLYRYRSIQAILLQISSSPSQLTGQALLARAHAAHATAQGDRRGAHAHEDELALRWADEALELAQELGDAPLEPWSQEERGGGRSKGP